MLAVNCECKVLKGALNTVLPNAYTHNCGNGCFGERFGRLAVYSILQFHLRHFRRILFGAQLKRKQRCKISVSLVIKIQRKTMLKE